MNITSFYRALSVLFLASLSLMVIGQAEAKPSFVGEMVTYYTEKEDDTLIEIAYREGLGYVEIRSANPDLDPWLPGKNRKVILPQKHLLPKADQEGIIVNLGEMRLYYFPPDGGEVETYPLGIGREGLLTPQGETKVTRKRERPTWTPTARMREEDPELPVTVPAGPDNPLGVAALYLGWPAYLIHGTNKPWGIGRRVSSGCIRMYNRDIRELYGKVPVGTKVNVVNQPVKTAWIDGRFHIEAHPNADQADKIVNTYEPIDYEVSEDELKTIFKAAGEYKDDIDWRKVRSALRFRQGYPIAVSNVVKDKLPEEPQIVEEHITEEDKAVIEDVAVEAEPVVEKTESEEIKPDKKPWEKKEADEVNSSSYSNLDLSNFNN